MPLLPIDLQTLFTQQTQVAKEQAAQKEAVPHAQSLQAAALVQKAAARDASVTEARSADEGPEQVRDRRGRQGRRRQKPAPGPAAKAPPAEEDVLRDPALGRNVDLTG